MTKEEKSEKYVFSNPPSVVIDNHSYFLPSDLKRAYLAGAKELEQENAELKKRLVFARAEFQKQYKENEQLKEQNTNLQIMLKAEREVRCNEDYLKRVCELEEKIEQAKEIIKRQSKIIEDVCDVSMLGSYAKETIKQAEQFLKEEA